MHEEIIDLVDENNQIIGQMTRSEVNKKIDSVFYRAVCAFIENDKGQLWIPRRTAEKRLFPLCLDMSIAGCVSSGESYELAFEREALEEVNINIQKISYAFLGQVTPQQGFSCFLNVYSIKQNHTPDYNPEDFLEYYWLTPQEILDRIEKGDKTKSDLPKLIHYFYLKNP